MKIIASVLWYVSGGLLISSIAGFLMFGTAFLDPTLPAFVFIYYSISASAVFALCRHRRLRDAFFLALLLYFIIFMVTANTPAAFILGHTLYYSAFMILTFYYSYYLRARLPYLAITGPVLFAAIYASYAFLLTPLMWQLLSDKSSNVWLHAFHNFQHFGRFALILALAWEVTRVVKRRFIVRPVS